MTDGQQFSSSKPIGRTILQPDWVWSKAIIVLYQTRPVRHPHRRLGAVGMPILQPGAPLDRTRSRAASPPPTRGPATVRSLVPGLPDAKLMNWLLNGDGARAGRVREDACHAFA